MTKKWLGLLLSAAMLLSAAGCATTNEGSSSSQEAGDSSSQASEDSSASSGTVDTSDATSIDTDIVVVGGGGTGLVAALAAADEGKQVIVLEKMGYLGGATGMSGGKVPAAGTKQQLDEGVEDSPEALARDIMRPGNYGQRMDLVELVANGAKDFIEWSEGQGVKWTLETDLLYYGQSTYRMHVSEGAGAGMIAALSETVNNHENITVMLETPGTGLISDSDGAVIGVTATSKTKGDLAINARAVILATSGFGANREMVDRYVPSIANAYPYVAPGATGEGILWGVELGADVRNMSAYQGYAPISYDTKKGLGQTLIDLGGFLVNANGVRFMDEVTGYSNLAAGIVNQPDAYAFMIFDATLAEGRDAMLEGWREDETLLEADSVESLAAVLGVDAANLQKEFDLYAQGIEAGQDYLNRTAMPAAFTAPYYAVKVTGDFRHTQGGLTIDLTTRVVKEDGTPIPGLYAGGGVAEGFSSTGGPGYMSGNGLLQAFVLGKIAGEEAAAY